MNPVAALANAILEFDWSLNISNLVDGATYFFRMALGDGTLFNSYSEYPSLTYDSTYDNTPPSPDPMTFATAPAPDSSTQISMTASTATDVGNPTVNYLFGYYDCASNAGTGGTSGSWQAGTSYSDSGLQPNRCYGYKVQARDSAPTPNTTASSTQAEIYTLANIPSSVTATADSATQITLSWSANSNPDGTEYYVTNTTLSTNSGWITDTSYINTGLTCNTSYNFEVKSRNANNVETSAATASQTTSACPVSDTPSPPGGDSHSNGGGGGGGTPAGVLINGGTATTTSSITALTLSAPFNARTMALSNTPGFASVAVLPFVNYLSYWNLCEKNICQPGTYTVYAKYYDVFGLPSQIYSDDIYVSGKLKADEPPGKPPRDTGLGVIITASLDGEKYFGSLGNVLVGQNIYLQGSVSGKKPGDKITYRFDCESDATADGIYEAIFENTPRKNIKTDAICSYPVAGNYLARVEILGDSSTIYDSLLIQVGGPSIVLPPVQPPTLPPISPLPPVEPPPPVVPPPIEPPVIENPPSEPPLEDPEPVEGLPPIIPIIEDIIDEIVDGGEIVADIIGSAIDATVVFAEKSIGAAIDLGRAGQEELRKIPIDPEVSTSIGTLLIAPSILMLQYSLGSQAIVIGNFKSLSDFGLTMLSLLQGLLTSLGLRKRRRYWGTVYDSITKQPIDPAIVELIDAVSGKVVEQSVTDLSGRFGFLDKHGRYYIRAGKTHYAFPSKLVLGINDGIFNNVYHGEMIEIDKPGDLLAPNIPMDPLAFDWNQEEKQKIIKFHPNLERAIQIFLNLLFWSGFAFILFNLISRPTLLNGLFSALYIALALLKKFLPSQKLWGRILSGQMDTAGLLLELSPKQVPQVTVAKALTIKGGKFFLKTAKGDYILKIKKIDGSNLVTVFESEVSVGDNGVVNDTIDMVK